MSKEELIRSLFEAEKAGREAATALQTAPKDADIYTSAPLDRLRKILGLLEDLEETGFDMIYEACPDDPEARYRAEAAWASEMTVINPLRSLLSRIAAAKYGYAAKCTLDGSRCEPDVRDIINDVKSIDTYEVDGIAESFAESWDEIKREMAEDYFNLVERLQKEVEEAEKEIEERRWIPYSVALKVGKAVDKIKEALSAICSLASAFPEGSLKDAAFAACHMKSIAEKLGGTAPVKDRLRVILNDRVRLDAEEIEAFKRASRALGRRVGFIIPDAKEGDEVSTAAALNDLANFIHEFAVALFRVRLREEALGRAGRRIGRCLISLDADSLLAAVCRYWDEAASLSATSYISADAAALEGIVAGKRADFKVGNAPGHRTVIEKEDGHVKLTYHDADGEIRAIMKRLFERIAGCRCEDRWEFVECVCPLRSEEDAKKLGVILSRATTMDIRFQQEAESAIEWGEAESYEELIEKYAEEEEMKVRELLEKIS